MHDPYAAYGAANPHQPLTDGERAAGVQDPVAAEQPPADRGGPLVLAATNFDLVCVLQGRSIPLRTLDGQEILVRLYTPDELLAEVERAGDRLEAQGQHRGPGMDMAKAIQLTTALPS